MTKYDIETESVTRFFSNDALDPLFPFAHKYNLKHCESSTQTKICRRNLIKDIKQTKDVLHLVTPGLNLCGGVLKNRLLILIKLETVTEAYLTNLILTSQM